MNRSETPILVMDATGEQGGAAARHLLRDGFRVRALVRDPSLQTAPALEDGGAELATLGGRGDRIETGDVTAA